MTSKSSTGKQIHEDLIIKKFFESYDYQKDPEYLDWEIQLYNENNKFTFEKTLDFCKIDWEFNEKWKETTKQKWLQHIRKWNMIRYERDRDNENQNEMSIVGYAAVTYLYVVLPYKLLNKKTDRSVEITEFQAKLINICMLSNINENFLDFKDYDMITAEDLIHNLNEQFLNEQYNSACWFLTFLIYLSEKNIYLGHKGALWA